MNCICAYIAGFMLKQQLKNNKKNEPRDLIFRCSERRLAKIFIEWMKNNIQIKKDPYLIYIPGSIHDLVNGFFLIRIYWWHRVFAFTEKKKIRKFVICNHDDCLIYGRKPKEKQIRDMNKVKSILERKYPDMEIVLIFANLVNKQLEQFKFEAIE